MSRRSLLLLFALSAQALVSVPSRVISNRRLVVRRSKEEEDAETLRARAAALREEVAKLQAEAALQAEADALANPPPEKKEIVPPPPPPAPPKRERIVDDDLPAASARALACLPYLLPLSDALPFGKYVLSEFPLIAIAIVGPVAPLLAIINVIPFGGLVVFIGLSTQTRNTELPRFIRFSCQQAIILDIALIFPQLLGQFAGALKFSLPESVVEPASTTVFFAVTLSIIYSVISNARGQTPDGIPGVSEATDRSIGPF